MKYIPYFQKLKDPRWQKLRLEVMERDGWKCRHCGNAEKTLNVHHNFYEKGYSPWDYPLSSLTTLCFDCHEALENEKQCLAYLVSRYTAMELCELTNLLNSLSLIKEYDEPLTMHTVLTFVENSSPTLLQLKKDFEAAHSKGEQKE